MNWFSYFVIAANKYGALGHSFPIVFHSLLECGLGVAFIVATPVDDDDDEQ